MDRIARIALNKARNELYTRGVAACKAEFAQRKQVRALQKANKPVPPELLEPIPDPEKEAKEEDIQEEANVSLVAYQQGDELWEEEDDVDINTGFIRFDKDQREFDGREFIDPGLLEETANSFIFITQIQLIQLLFIMDYRGCTVNC